VVKRFFPKNYGFFDLFDRHTTCVLEATRVMLDAVKNLSAKDIKVTRIGELEHECDSITHMAIDLLHRTFITPLDRDEILELVSRMDDIMDFIDAAAHRLVLFEITEVPKDILQLCEVLIEAQNQVTEMVKLLRHMKKTEDLHKHCMEINRLENEGDQLHRRGIAALFHTYANDPLMVIKLKEVYEVLEAAIDRCEDVANLAESIVLEHT